MPNDNQQTVAELQSALGGGPVYKIVNGKLVEFSGELMEKLTMQIVRHGHKCWEAGRQVGLDTAAGKLEPEEEG